MFYDNYVRLCNNVNKSPSSVAEELGLSRASVNGWKRGKTPTDATLGRVADYFGVTSESLLNEDFSKWLSYKEREQRYEYEQIEKNASNPMNKRIDAALGRIYAYYSRSIEVSGFDRSHISFEEYIPYFLFSQKHIFASDVYSVLIEKYGTKEGMKSTTWDCSSNRCNNKTVASISDGQNAVILEDEMLVGFPIVGSISAGYTSLAVEEYTGEFAPIPLSSLHGPLSNYFVLRVSGDSMYPYLLNGDLVLVRRESMVENGKVAVVLYNGDEATIKKVKYKQGEYIDLIPNNPEYKTKHIEGSDLEQCHILGEVIQLIRNVF